MPDHPELLLRERAWLHALARQLVQPHESADELTHDALAAACTNQAPRTAGPRAWLAAILKRQLAGQRRSAHRRSAHESRAARPEGVPPVDDTVVRFEVQRDVANAVLALSEPYRSTVLLRFWDGLSPAAIGRRMDVPTETVRTRLKRGLALLRERLDRAHGGDRRAWAVPLWAAARPSGPLAAALAGVSFMSATKYVVGVAAAAAGLFLWSFWPSSPAGTALPVARTEGSTAAVGAVTPPADTASHSNDSSARVALASGADAAALVVHGTVVDDETSAPLAGVAVRLVGSTLGEDLGIQGSTEPDGTFTLREARVPQRDGRQVAVEGDDYAVARLYASFDREREGQQQIDVGTIRLARGTLFSGQVFDTDGRGVADAELMLPRSIHHEPWGPGLALSTFDALARSDTAGRFNLAKPIAPDTNHGSLLFAVSPSGIGWCSFEASRQRRQVTDLVVRLRPSGGLRVVVEDPEGRPCAGAEVDALPRFGPLGIERRDWRELVSRVERVRAVFAGRTDAAGAVLLPGLPVGDPHDFRPAGVHERLYDVAVEAAGYPQQPLHAVEVRPGTEQRLVVRLARARRIAVSVEVRDDLGAPIVGAEVTGSEEHAVHARTDAAGLAQLSLAWTSEGWISAEAPGHRPARSRVSLATNAPSRVVLTLARTLPLDGRVVDQFGAPVPGVHLFVEHSVLARTDADGRFHVDAFPRGSQRIQVSFPADRSGARWTGKQTPEVVDAERGPVTITMERRIGSVDVRVAVVDAATGEALEPIDTRLGLFTEELNGFYVSVRAVASPGLIVSPGTVAGRWQLCVRTATGHRGSLVFTLSDGQPPVDLRLELPRPGTITGRLQFHEVTAPATVTLSAGHATRDRDAWSQFRYPGRWRIDPASQTVTSHPHGATCEMQLQPARNASFYLESADPTDTLVFTVDGEGVAGEARVRVDAGQTREVVIDVRARQR